MRGARPLWLRLRARILCGFAAPALLSFTPAISLADDKPENLPAVDAKPVDKAAKPATGPMTLEACRQLALEKQPAVAAARASLAAAEARTRAVQRLCLATLVSPDLPVRKKQATFGLQISQAAVTQAEWDAQFGVTWAYLTAKYARQQNKVAETGVEELTELKKRAQELLNAKFPDMTQYDVDRVAIILQVAQSRGEEAAQGEARALSALREAIGLCADDELEIDDAELTATDPPSKEQLVAEALARRGEVNQADTATRVYCLEVEAQRRVLFGLNVRTFASGSDIHAREVPAGLRDESYRPGAVHPEMPVFLGGRRGDRIEQAQAYYGRSEAVAQTTRNLVTLETEQAYLRWKEADGKAKQLRKAATDARIYYQGDDNGVKSGIKGMQRETPAKVKIGDAVNAGILVSQVEVAANEAEYKRLINLAALERITAGGYSPGWTQKPAEPKEDDSEK